MPKVTIIQVIYNSRKFIEPVFNAIFNQTFKDFNVVAVISGNDDGSKELLMEKFPSVEIIDPGFNIGFAKGHNLVFSKFNSEFFQLVNPDMIMEPNYIEEILKVFKDPKVGAATGKLYQFKDLPARHRLLPKATAGGRLKIEDFRQNNTIDTTGVSISKSGRARDRGQHEVDSGQYDNLTDVDAVSAAGAMYRKSALKATSYPFDTNKLPTTNYQLQASIEYFDEDFHSYWEDVDLSWRMKNAGYKCKFVPSAIGYHGRGAGSSKNGYKDIFGFIKHHKALSPRVRQLNYQNHVFMYIKNSKYFYPQFFVREFFMFLYILIFETKTLKILPKMIKMIPKMLKKRNYVINHVIQKQ